VSADGVPRSTVVVNGDERPLESGMTIGSLLEELGLDPRTVAVEHNGSVLKRGHFVSIELAAGDRLEIVRFVQGGVDRRPRRSPSGAC